MSDWVGRGRVGLCDILGGMKILVRLNVGGEKLRILINLLAVEIVLLTVLIIQGIQRGMVELLRAETKLVDRSN